MGQGYHSANLVQQDHTEENELLIESLQHLALAAPIDKQTIAQLVESNAKLIDNVSTLIAKLTQALQTVATLTGALAPKRRSNTQMKYDQQMDPVGYCWSHGYKVKVGYIVQHALARILVIKSMQRELTSWETVRHTKIGCIHNVLLFHLIVIIMLVMLGQPIIV